MSVRLLLLVFGFFNFTLSLQLCELNEVEQCESVANITELQRIKLTHDYDFANATELRENLTSELKCNLRQLKDYQLEEQCLLGLLKTAKEASDVAEISLDAVGKKYELANDYVDKSRKFLDSVKGKVESLNVCGSSRRKRFWNNFVSAVKSAADTVQTEVISAAQLAKTAICGQFNQIMAEFTNAKKQLYQEFTNMREVENVLNTARHQYLVLKSAHRFLQRELKANAKLRKQKIKYIGQLEETIMAIS